MPVSDTLRELPRSDAAVYVGTGLFAIAVFAIALTVATRYGAAGLGTDGEITGLVVGFSVFMAVYFVSLGVWYSVRE